MGTVYGERYCQILFGMVIGVAFGPSSCFLIVKLIIGQLGSDTFRIQASGLHHPLSLDQPHRFMNESQKEEK